MIEGCREVMWRLVKTAVGGNKWLGKPPQPSAARAMGTQGTRGKGRTGRDRIIFALGDRWVHRGKRTARAKGRGAPVMLSEAGLRW